MWVWWRAHVTKSGSNNKAWLLEPKSKQKIYLYYLICLSGYRLFIKNQRRALHCLCRSSMLSKCLLSPMYLLYFVSSDRINYLTLGKHCQHFCFPSLSLSIQEWLPNGTVGLIETMYPKSYFWIWTDCVWPGKTLEWQSYLLLFRIQ